MCFIITHNAQRYGAWLIFLVDTFWPLRLLFRGRNLQEIRNLAMHYNACYATFFKFLIIRSIFFRSTGSKGKIEVLIMTFCESVTILSIPLRSVNPRFFKSLYS